MLTGTAVGAQMHRANLDHVGMIWKVQAATPATAPHEAFEAMTQYREDRPDAFVEATRRHVAQRRSFGGPAVSVATEPDSFALPING
jgi:hypothetical protein